MGQQNTTPIGKLPLFATLPKHETIQLNEQLSATARTVQQGHILAERGTPMDHLFILIDGNAHAEIITGDGHALIVESFHGPDAIATAMLFAPQPHFPVSLIADSVCIYTSLPRNSLLDLCQKYRSVLEALLTDAGRRTAFLASRLRLTQFASLRQRIAVYITEAKPRKDRNGVEYVYVPHSRQELADMFGVARPSLSRELSRMGDEGLIWADGNTVQIIDRPALETLVTGCE